MSKRFIDSDIWKKEWFCDLSPALKSFWVYIFSNCDNAGVWETNIRLAEYQIGAKITEEEILTEFKGNIVKLDNGKLFIVDFISFQWGDLKEDSVPHRNVFRLLEKHGISYPIDRVSIEYQGVSNTPKAKEEDKEKDKEKEKEKKKEKEEDFKNEVFAFTSYPIEMLEKFIDYWTEWNKSNTKMRFELEKTWEIGKRLATWASRSKDFNKPQTKTFGRQEISMEELRDQMKDIKLS